MACGISKSSSGMLRKGSSHGIRRFFGNIFVRLRNAEREAGEAQIKYEADPSPTNREYQNRRTAEYLLCLQMEEDFWRQKASIRWVVEGERNTKFYQCWVRQKRIKTRIHEIKVDGISISNEEELRQYAVRFYQNLLTSDVDLLEEPLLDIINRSRKA